VDFAYTIHTEVGHTCVGAKINGRMAPLRTKLRTGDIVEIVTQKDHKPSRDWLTFVKSPRARNKIKHWLNEDQRARAVEIGRKLLEREARKFKVPMTQIDDAINEEDLTVPFAIFNLYAQRAYERFAYARTLLKEGFDFRQKESYQYAREKEAWPKSELEMRELWRKRVIREQEPNTYDFTHDKLREVAYGETSVPQRRLLHRRVAEVLVVGIRGRHAGGVCLAAVGLHQSFCEGSTDRSRAQGSHRGGSAPNLSKRFENRV